jgi:hypothetical protein
MPIVACFRRCLIDTELLPLIASFEKPGGREHGFKGREMPFKARKKAGEVLCKYVFRAQQQRQTERRLQQPGKAAVEAAVDAVIPALEHTAPLLEYMQGQIMREYGALKPPQALQCAKTLMDRCASAATRIQSVAASQVARVRSMQQRQQLQQLQQLQQQQEGAKPLSPGWQRVGGTGFSRPKQQVYVQPAAQGQNAHTKQHRQEDPGLQCVDDEILCVRRVEGPTEHAKADEIELICWCKRAHTADGKGMGGKGKGKAKGKGKGAAGGKGAGGQRGGPAVEMSLEMGLVSAKHRTVTLYRAYADALLLTHRQVLQLRMERGELDQEAAAEAEGRVLSRLFCMAMRYETLFEAKSGHQAALPPDVFEIMHQVRTSCIHSLRPSCLHPPPSSSAFATSASRPHSTAGPARA